MLLEPWIMALLQDIKEAAEKGKNYDLHLEKETVREIAGAYDATTWIEIY